MGVHGSLRKATINGIPFDVAADADVAQNAKVEIEEIVHSGGSSFKRTDMGGSAEAVKFILSPSEYELLQTLGAEALLEYTGGLVGVPLSYEEADGSVNRTTGTINIGPRQTADGSCEVKMMPALKDGWDIFAAS